MPTTIHFQGGSVDVAETYNNVRHRINHAEVQRLNALAGEPVTNTRGATIKYTPSHFMSFTLLDEEGEPSGRFTLNLEKYICTTSDEEAD